MKKTKAEIDSIKRRDEVYQKYSERNKDDYSEIYKEFFSRGGLEWYSALTGELMDGDRMFIDIDYFKMCLYEGLEAEGHSLSGCDDYSSTMSDWGESSQDRFNGNVSEFKSKSGADRSSARRRILILLGTPEWANMDEIKMFYKRRAEVSSKTGVPHAVDHIVPVVHDKVCGLNVEFNLRVITAAENSRKSNKFAVG